MRTRRTPLSDEMIGAVAHRFHALSEPVRLRILESLEEGELTVSQVVDALQGSQPNISRHLAALFDAGLLKRRREGTSIYYAIADPMVLKLCDLVCSSARAHARQKLHALAGSPR